MVHVNQSLHVIGHLGSVRTHQDEPPRASKHTTTATSSAFPITTERVLRARSLAKMDMKRKISSAMPESVVDPSKWLSSYGDFITKNSSAVAQIESGLRSLTYIIPGTASKPIRTRRAPTDHDQAASENQN